MKKIKVVQAGQFCNVQTSTYAEYGVKRGDTVYLAGTSQVLVTEDNPYLFELLFIAAFMKDNHVLADKKPFLIKGLNLKGCTKPRQARLEGVFANDFAVAEEAEEPVVDNVVAIKA
jgi:hypothetical protein